jgi:hypothetical protein
MSERRPDAPTGSCARSRTAANAALTALAIAIAGCALTMAGCASGDRAKQQVPATDPVDRAGEAPSPRSVYGRPASRRIANVRIVAIQPAAADPRSFIVVACSQDATAAGAASDYFVFEIAEVFGGAALLADLGLDPRDEPWRWDWTADPAQGPPLVVDLATSGPSPRVLRVWLGGPELALPDSQLLRWRIPPSGWRSAGPEPDGPVPG